MPFKWRQPATAPWHNRSTTKESGRGAETGCSSAGESVGERQLRHFICAVARSVADAEACWCFYHLLSAACCSSCRCWGQRCRCCSSALLCSAVVAVAAAACASASAFVIVVAFSPGSCQLPCACCYWLCPQTCRRWIERRIHQAQAQLTDTLALLCAVLEFALGFFDLLRALAFAFSCAMR